MTGPHDSVIGVEADLAIRRARTLTPVRLKPAEGGVRIEGAVVRVTEEESNEYFATRPRGSQLGAWASEQSKVIAGRGDLDARFEELSRTYGDRPIPRPPHWGGYRVIPILFEFWQGRPDRLHDRFAYRLRNDSKDWVIERLSP